MKKHLSLFLFLITLWIMPIRVSAVEEDTADNANDSDNTSQRSNQDQDSERQSAIAANQENNDGITDNPITPSSHIDSVRRPDHSFSADEYKSIDQHTTADKYTDHSRHKPNQNSMSFPSPNLNSSSSSPAASVAGADVEHEREGASAANPTSSDGRITPVLPDTAAHRSSGASASSGGAAAAAAIEAGRVAVASEPAVTIASRPEDRIPEFDLGPIEVNGINVTTSMVDRYLATPYPENRPQMFNYIVSTVEQDLHRSLSIDEKVKLHGELQKRLAQYNKHYQPPSFGEYISKKENRSSEQEDQYRDSLEYSKKASAQLRTDRTKQELRGLIRDLSGAEEQNPTLATAIANVQAIIDENERRIDAAIATLVEDSPRNRAFNAYQRNHTLAAGVAPITSDDLSTIIYKSTPYCVHPFQRNRYFNTVTETFQKALRQVNDTQSLASLQALKAIKDCSNALVETFKYLTNEDTNLQELQMTRVERSYRMTDGFPPSLETCFKTHFQNFYSHTENVLSQTQQITNLHIQIMSHYAAASTYYLSDMTYELDKANTEIEKAHQAENELQGLTQEYLLK